MEFKPFPDIKKLSNVQMNITQKIHGTNAQILIVEFPDNIEDAERWMVTADAIEVDGKYYHVKTGSRTRWITPLDDNYGFAAFVEKNKVEFVRKLGVGQHHGEWAGPGINSGEGLKERTFVLFAFWNFPPEKSLPPQTAVVPVLYSGSFDGTKIDETMEELKTTGSKLVPGFMRTEGIVVGAMGTRFKKVFSAEETAWKKPSGIKNTTPKVKVDLSYLLQPIRMEKLLSRDEAYLRDYPKSLPRICKAYVEDLEKEDQIKGETEAVTGIKKNLGSQLFPFAIAMVEKQLQLQTTGE